MRLECGGLRAHAWNHIQTQDLRTANKENNESYVKKLNVKKSGSSTFLVPLITIHIFKNVRSDCRLF